MKTNMNTPRGERSNVDGDDEVEAQDEELAAVLAATKKKQKEMPDR
jgi:hypothetical protein